MDRHMGDHFHRFRSDPFEHPSAGSSTHDMERITGDLSPFPVFVPPAFMEVFGVHRLNPEWLIEIFIASVLPAATLLLLPWVKDSVSAPGQGLLYTCLIGLIGLFPFLEFSLTGLSYRLFFGTLLMLPLIGYIPICCWLRKSGSYHVYAPGNPFERVCLCLFSFPLLPCLFTPAGHTGLRYTIPPMRFTKRSLRMP